MNFRSRKAVGAVLAALWPVFSVCGQLAITEATSSAATNLGPKQVTQNPDFWELTNFGTNTIALTGYKWDDNSNNLTAADPTPFEGLSIGPGESIVFVQTDSATLTTNAAAFRAWWGTNVASSVKIVFYSGNGFGSGGDGIRLWGPNAQTAADVVDSVDFVEARRGSSFTYDPVTGEFGSFSTNGVNGAFKAETTDDVGSPGRNTGPTPLTITQQPADVLVNPGDNARFTVAIRGRPRGSFQWRFNDAAVAGATAATLEITNVQAAATGRYSVAINNGIQTVISTQAQLVLQSQATAPVFTQVPTDLLMYAGQSFTFRAAASGLPAPTFQWQFNGGNIAGATTSEFGLFGVSEQETGLYAVIARNAVGAVTNNFRVTVAPKPLLIITEVMSSSSTNVPAGTPTHEDWWEVTNFGTNQVSLKGFRLDDSSESLTAAYTITNDVAMLPGESVILTERMTAEAFRQWWGEGNLPAGLKIITYSAGGIGLSSTGDAVYLWNAAAAENSDRIANVVFSTATAGVSFGYNPDTSTIGALSVAGQFGAFVAAVGGDIGSPGYIRDTPRPLRFTEVASVAAGVRLTWSANAGSNYTLQFKAQLDAAAWTTLTNITANGATITVEDAIPAGAAQRFYRIATAQ